MTPSATTPRTINITGMLGDDCVQRVTAALKNVSGVTTDAVSVGRATVTCAYPAAYASACSAITSAGFKTLEETAPAAQPTSHQTDCAGPTIGALDPAAVEIAQPIALV